MPQFHIVTPALCRGLPRHGSCSQVRKGCPSRWPSRLRGWWGLLPGRPRHKAGVTK